MKQEVLLAVFGMVSVGVADVLRSRGLTSGGSPATYFAIETGFVALLSVIAVFLLEGTPNLTRGVMISSPISGILIFAGTLDGSDHRGSKPIRTDHSAQFWATLVFGESLTLSKGVGVLMAVGAVILLSLDF